MLSAQELTCDNSNLFEALKAGSDQAATSPDQAARLLRQAKQQFQQKLEEEDMSASSIASISDNETPKPQATAALKQFILICTKIIYRSFKDHKMASTLAKQMADDPCGEKEFPTDQTWWEVDPELKTRKKSPAYMVIPKKGRKKSLPKPYTGAPTPLQTLCKELQQKCYTMVRANMPSLAKASTRRRVNAAIRDLEDARGILNDPRRLENPDKRPSLEELQDIVLERTLDVEDGRFYISKLLQMSRRSKETLADYARRINDLRTKCIQTKRTAATAGRESFSLPDSLFVGQLALFIVKGNSQTTTPDLRDEEAKLRKALRMGPGQRFSKFSWQVMYDCVRRTLQVHELHEYQTSWCKKGYKSILYPFGVTVQENRQNTTRKKAVPDDPRNKGKKGPKHKRARITKPCSLCLKDLGLKIYHAQPCDDMRRYKKALQQGSKDRAAAILAAIQRSSNRKGSNQKRSNNLARPGSGVTAERCPPDQVHLLCPYCKVEPGYTWQQAIHKWPPRQCFNRPDGPLKGITDPKKRAEARKREVLKRRDASKARRAAAKATTKRSVGFVEDDVAIEEAAAKADCDY